MIDTHLRAFLITQSSINSIVAGIYPVRLPQADTGTNIVYEIDSGMRDLISGGVGGVERHGVTLSVFSTSYASTRAVSQTLIDLLHGYEGSMGLLHITASHSVTQLNTFEEDQGLYRAILTFDIYTQ